MSPPQGPYGQLPHSTLYPVGTGKEKAVRVTLLGRQANRSPSSGAWGITPLLHASASRGTQLNTRDSLLLGILVFRTLNWSFILAQYRPRGLS